MSKYVGGDTIKDIKYPNFEEYVKEYEKRVEKGDQTSSVDFVGYGWKVWKFLSDMKTTTPKPPRHYDEFLKNVKDIFTKFSGVEPNEKGVRCFMDNKFIQDFYVEEKKYIKEGKNEERKDRLKEFWEKSFKPFTRRVSENALCSNSNIKEQAETEGNRTIDNPLYKKVYLGGKVWEKTKPESGISIFQNNKFMKTLTLGKGVKTVSKGTFENCQELEHIYIEAEALTIEKEAIKNCKELNKVEVSSSVKKLTIEEEAFSGCDKLKTIDLNSFSGKLEVESGAFNKCGELRRKSISGDEKSKAVLAIKAVLPE